MSETKSIKVGIIGGGKIAYSHAEQYKKLPWVEVLGVADIVPGKAAAFIQTAGLAKAKPFVDYHQMLDTLGLDVVSVCSYNMAHRAPVVDSLGAGVNVLLEKPMAATLEDAKAIMKARKTSGKLLMIGFQPEFSSEYKAAHTIAESGALGKVYYGEAVTHRRWGVPGGTFMRKDMAGAGTLVDTGVYAIHATLWLMGDPKPVAVTAMTTNHLTKAFKGTAYGGWAGPWTAKDMEVEEFAVGFIRFENGAVMVHKATWAGNADSMGRTFVMGTKGGLQLNPLEFYVNQKIGDLNMTSTVKGLETVDQWAAKIGGFCEAVRDNKPSPLDPHRAFLVNVIMDGILRSAECGCEVKVEAAY